MLSVKEWLNVRKYASDEILAKWRATGLLHGLDENSKRALAKLFEDIEQVLLQYPLGSDTSQVLFPIARSTYCTFGHYIRNVYVFCEYVDTNLHTRCNRTEAIKAYEINTGEKYNQKEMVNKAKLRRPEVELPDDYLCIDIHAEISYLIAREVAEKKI
jgi:hypothetical protein